MFYYHEHVPNKDVLVVGNIQRSQETESSVYVALPEFNNIIGIILKSDLPRKRKTFLRILKNINKQGIITCKVAHDPQCDENGNPRLIDLSIKGIDEKINQVAIDRFRNIGRIIKIVKFISLEYSLSYDDLIKRLNHKYIVPLDVSIEVTDDDIGIDDLSDLYMQYLCNSNRLVDMLELSNDIYDKVSDGLHQLIKEVESTSTLDFDLTVWGTYDKDAVYIIRDMFVDVLTKNNNIQIRYIGAPTYQIILPAIKTKDIDNTYIQICTQMKEFLNANNITGYDITFDPSIKNLKNGDATISFPYKIDLE